MRTVCVNMCEYVATLLGVCLRSLCVVMMSCCVCIYDVIEYECVMMSCCVCIYDVIEYECVMMMS